MRSKRLESHPITILNCVVLLLSAVSFGVSASTTFDQQASGEALYYKHCETCHGAGLRGGAHGSELKGLPFQNAWGDKTTGELFAYNRVSMPPGRSGGLADEEHWALVAYILQVNKVAVSKVLSETAQVLIGSGDDVEAIDIGSNGAVAWDGAAGVDEMARSISSFQNKTLETYTPVSMETLLQPNDGEWLSWRRTLDGQAYSPLNHCHQE